MEQTTNNTQNDVIDLRELWQVLIKRKIMIVLLTLLITIGAIIYAVTAKPVYSGSAMLEVGQIVNEQFSDGKYSSLKREYIDNLDTLKILVSKTSGVSTSIPKKTKLLTISINSNDKTHIKKKLEEAISYVLDRHKELAKLYSGQNAKIKMTQLVGDITVGDTAIKPKRKLIVIVAFITGLMLSVFLAFFLEFIGGMKKEENSA